MTSLAKVSHVNSQVPLIFMCQEPIPFLSAVEANRHAVPEGIIAPEGTQAPEVRADGSETVRVLVVDDQQDILDMMEVMMRRRSFQVMKANSGAQAIKLAPHFAPHVIVSDISMPGMDGYQMMCELRAMNGLRAFKAIALSGFDANEEKERAQNAGYDVQLTKPVDFESLMQTIVKLHSKV